MYEPEHADILTLHNALRDFGQKFIQQQGADKIRKFQEGLPEDERIQVASANARLEFNKSSGADLNENMVGLLFYFSRILPGLRREFGDAAVYDALDYEVQRPAVVNLCDHVGAREVAQFFREGRNKPKPS